MNSGVTACTTPDRALLVVPNPSPTVTGAAVGCLASGVVLSTQVFTAYQWIKDGSDIPGASSQNYTATVSGTYSVRVTSTEGCQGTASGFAVTLGSGPQPTVTGLHNNTCPTPTVTLSTGTFVAYQWRYNGAVIPGATSQTCAASLSGNYSVTTRDEYGCQATSGAYAVFVAYCPSSEVSPASAAFPARLVKNGSSPTGFYLTFQRLDTPDGYNMYEGTMGTYYSHASAPGNLCTLTVTDLGTGEMRIAITPSAGDHYYLVTAYGGGTEGPSGFDGQSIEIPAAQSTCAP